MSRDELVAEAKNLPHLLMLAEDWDPVLAQRLKDKPVASSKTVWGAAITLLVSQLVTRFGLGWDQDTCQIVGGVLTIGVVALAHWLDCPSVVQIGQPEPDSILDKKDGK